MTVAGLMRLENGSFTYWPEATGPERVFGPLGRVGRASIHCAEGPSLISAAFSLQSPRL